MAHSVHGGVQNVGRKRGRRGAQGTREGAGVLDRGPTDDDPPVILDMIAKALPGDEHAAKLGSRWEAEQRQGS